MFLHYQTYLILRLKTLGFFTSLLMRKQIHYLYYEIRNPDKTKAWLFGDKAILFCHLEIQYLETACYKKISKDKTLLKQ